MAKRYVGVRNNKGRYAEVFIEEDGYRRPLPIIHCFFPHDIDWTGGPASDNLALSIFADVLGEPKNEAEVLTSRSASAAAHFAGRILTWLPTDTNGSGRRAQSWSFDEEDLRRWAAANQSRFQARDRLNALSSFLTSHQSEIERIEQEMPHLESEVLLLESEIKRKIIVERPCHTCHGTGAIRECPECHGRGAIYGLDSSGRPGGATCSGCNGTGKNMRQNGECPNCWGKGYEWRDQNVSTATGCLGCLLPILSMTVGMLTVVYALLMNHLQFQ